MIQDSQSQKIKSVGETKPFNGVKVFSATMAQERENLGERITTWLKDRKHVKVVDTIVTQSSDASFHCLAITVFYWEENK